MNQVHQVPPVPHTPDKMNSIDSIFQPAFDGYSEVDYASASSMIGLDEGVFKDFSDSDSEVISLGSSANSLDQKFWDSEYDTFASEDDEDHDHRMETKPSETFRDESAVSSDLEYASCSSLVDPDEKNIDSPKIVEAQGSNSEILSLGSSTGTLGQSTYKHEVNYDSEYDTFASEDDDDYDNDIVKPEPPKPKDEPYPKSSDVDIVSTPSMNGLEDGQIQEDSPLSFDERLSTLEDLSLKSSKDSGGQVFLRDESDSEYDTFESEDDDNDTVGPELPTTKEDLYLQSIFDNFVKFGTLPRVRRKTSDVKPSESIFQRQVLDYAIFPKKWTYGTLPRPRPKARSTLQSTTFSTFGTYSRSHSIMPNWKPTLNRNLESIPEQIGTTVHGHHVLTSESMAKHGIKEVFEHSRSTIPRSFQSSFKNSMKGWNKFEWTKWSFLHD